MLRSEIINTIISINNYTRYLEIGVLDPSHNLNKIKCAYKIGVDPNGSTTHTMTSDSFFANNKDIFDIVFIDGLHLEEQVDKDIKNSLKFLSTNGTIVLHDCLPQSEDHQRDEYGGEGLWCGTVWKSIAKLRMQQVALDIKVVDTDYGCGIISKGKNKPFPKVDLNYKSYVQHRNSLMNVISVQEFKDLYV